MKCAPILIPTLYRYEHLKRCIESLKSNSYAKYTDLYIALDYPDKKDYWEGYNKIDLYLSKDIFGFKKSTYGKEKIILVLLTI